MRASRIALAVIAAAALTGVAVGDGMVIVRPWPRPPVPRPGPVSWTTALEVKYHRVKVNITDQSAETVIDQVFHNPENRQMEGTYIFPLPDDVAVNRFTMYMGKNEVVGKILDKDTARKTYEDIVRKMKDPALLEYMGTRVYQARIFPIPPRGDVRVTLTYSHLCPADEGIVFYRYPLNTEKFSAKPLEDVSVAVTLSSKVALKNIYSPSHKVKVVRKDDHTASVSYEDKNVKPDTDFLLYYAWAKKDFGLNLITHRPSEGAPGYFMALLSPKQKVDADSLVPKDIVFVVDTSGSMTERDKMGQARKALVYCVKQLKAHDRFTVIPFSHEPEPFHDKLVTADKAAIADAVKRAETIEAAGGTNINDTLVMALGLADKAETRRPFFVVFLTDGKPTVGTTTNVKDILKNVSAANAVKARLFVFGVGHDVNTTLLDALAAQNRGLATYVEPDEDIEVKVSSFYNKVAFPVLSDLALDLGVETKDLFPREVPDLFVGSQLVVLGRYHETGDKAITLTGVRQGKPWKGVYEGSFPNINERNPFLPRLWALRKVGYLLEQIRIHGDNKELKDEIVRLSKKYGIMTPYTSFLVMEDVKRGGAPAPAGVRHSLDAMAPKAEAGRRNFGGQSGGGAVDASKAIGGYKHRTTVAEGKDGENGWGLRDRTGRRLIKHVADKTFYRDGDKWIDSAYDGKAKTVKVTYFSDAYFALVAKHPTLGKYLALGKNVTVILGEKVYEIGE